MIPCNMHTLVLLDVAVFPLTAKVEAVEKRIQPKGDDQNGQRAVFQQDGEKQSKAGQQGLGNAAFHVPLVHLAAAVDAGED